jgi:branched-chain amino acid transport system substrate-binding protein
MTKPVIIVDHAAFVSVSCTAPWASSSSAGSTTQEIKIASDLPLAGPLGLGARPLSDAIELAIHDQGNVGGYRLSHLSLDDSLNGTFSGDKAEQNMALAVNDPNVLAVIGPFSSGAAHVDIPLANPSHLVIVSPSNTSDCLTSNSSPCVDRPAPYVNNYFRIAAAASAQASAAARFAIQSLQMKRVAVLDDGSDSSKYFADRFTGTLVALGGTVALRRTYSPTDSDFTGLLHDAALANAEAVYGPPASSGVCRLRAEMASIFPRGSYLLGDDGFAGPGCIEEAGPGADDHLLAMVSDSQPPPDRAIYKEFHAHGIPPVPYAFAAYDCARIVIDAIGRAVHAAGGKVPTRKQVLEAVAATQDFAGATGSYTFAPSGDAELPAVSVYHVEDGKWTFWQNAPSLPRSTAGTPLDGKWEVTFTRRELLAHTSDPGEDNPGNYGHFILSFAQGLFRGVGPDGSPITGTYVVAGAMVTFFRTDSDGPGEVWTFGWSISGASLTFVKAGRGEHPTPLIVKSWSRVTS